MVEDTIDLVVTIKESVGIELFLHEEEYDEETSKSQGQAGHFDGGKETAANDVSPGQKKLQREHVNCMYRILRIALWIVFRNGPTAWCYRQKPTYVSRPKCKSVRNSVRARRFFNFNT